MTGLPRVCLKSILGRTEAKPPKDSSEILLNQFIKWKALLTKKEMGGQLGVSLEALCCLVRSSNDFRSFLALRYVCFLFALP